MGSPSGIIECLKKMFLAELDVLDPWFDIDFTESKLDIMANLSDENEIIENIFELWGMRVMESSLDYGDDIKEAIGKICGQFEAIEMINILERENLRMIIDITHLFLSTDKEEVCKWIVCDHPDQYWQDCWEVIDEILIKPEKSETDWMKIKMVYREGHNSHCNHWPDPDTEDGMEMIDNDICELRRERMLNGPGS
jgi:hypothetical protein